MITVLVDDLIDPESSFFLKLELTLFAGIRLRGLRRAALQ